MSTAHEIQACIIDAQKHAETIIELFREKVMDPIQRKLFKSLALRMFRNLSLRKKVEVRALMLGHFEIVP